MLGRGSLRGVFVVLVRLPGLEPGTSTLKGSCSRPDGYGSSQLSYRRLLVFMPQALAVREADTSRTFSRP